MDLSNLNDLVVLDFYVKDGPDLYPAQYSELNNRVQAMHNLYCALYTSGILRNVSFEYREYDDIVYFAFKATDIANFLQNCSDTDMTSLAIKYITQCPKCRYTGAIQPGMFMQTYRYNCGCIGKTYECIIAQWLDNEACGMMYHERITSNVENAVKLAFKLACFK